MAFMEPETHFGDVAEVTDKHGDTNLCPVEYLEGDQDVADLVVHSNVWIARLSAAGYMDCTDWTGPYESEEQAVKELTDFYDICPHCFESCWEDQLCEEAAAEAAAKEQAEKEQTP